MCLCQSLQFSHNSCGIHTCMYVCTYNTLSYMYMYYMYLGVLKKFTRKTYTALVLSVVAIMLYIYYCPMYIYTRTIEIQLYLFNTKLNQKLLHFMLIVFCDNSTHIVCTYVLSNECRDLTMFMVRIF